MAISNVTDIDINSLFQAPTIVSPLVDKSDSVLLSEAEESKTPFDTIFDSAVRLISETNAYSNAAEVEEMKFAMGETDSIHDVQIAQQKANISLQYTVAVRDALVSAYKELMNMQF